MEDYLAFGAAQVIVLAINGLIIWLATHFYGSGGKGFITALKVSFLEIIGLYAFTIIVLFILVIIIKIIEVAAIPALDLFIYHINWERTLLGIALVLDFIFMGVILIYLIRRFYKLSLKSSFKAACFVLIIDLPLGCMIWIPLLVSGDVRI